MAFKLSWRTTFVTVLGLVFLPGFASGLDKPGQAGGQEGEWGKEKNGLRSRLALVRGTKVGESVSVRLELQNVGTEVRSYDSQQARVNGSLDVKGPDDKPVPYVDLSYQTVGQSKKLQPGEVVTIFDQLDVAEQYLLDRAGKYWIRFRGRDAIPASNELTITLEDGSVSVLTQFYSRLRGVAPADWQVSKARNAVIVSHSPTGLKKDVASIQVWFTKEKKSGFPDPKSGPPNLEYAGETKLGHAWLSATDEVRTRWPKHGDAIQGVLKAFAGPAVVEKDGK